MFPVFNMYTDFKMDDSENDEAHDYNDGVQPLSEHYEFKDDEDSTGFERLKHLLGEWPLRLWEASSSVYWPRFLTVKEMHTMLLRNRPALTNHAKYLKKLKKDEERAKKALGEQVVPFFRKYDVLRKIWGYPLLSRGQHTKFELRSHEGQLRKIQFVTDILMRFLRDGHERHQVRIDMGQGSPIRMLSLYDAGDKLAYESAAGQKLITDYLNTKINEDEATTVKDLLEQFVEECNSQYGNWPDEFQAACLSAEIILAKLDVSEDNVQTLEEMVDTDDYQFKSPSFIVPEQRAAAGAGSGGGLNAGESARGKQSARVKPSARGKQSARVKQSARGTQSARRKQSTRRKQSARGTQSARRKQSARGTQSARRKQSSRGKQSPF